MVRSAAACAADVMYMERALAQAARGRGRTSPNPIVGAVVVSSEGVVVGQGHHERAGLPHAEVHALAAAGLRAKGATLYCTLEPCSHQGRTPPCVRAIVDAGISRVVAAVEDPNPVVRGAGFAFLRAHGVQVEIGPGSAAAIDLNQPFFTLMRHRRPFVIMKSAVTLDGCIAAAPGRRTPLTGEAANRHAHAIRAEVDAIGVGVGTILVDDPLLTVRAVFRERPLTRVIFDRHLRTPAFARVLSTHTAGPVIIIATAPAVNAETCRALADQGAEILTSPDASLASALRILGDRQVGSLLLEGGGRLHRAAWDEDLVDYVQLYVTPKPAGLEGVAWLPDRSAGSAFSRFSTGALLNRRTRTLGSDVLIEGYVHGPR